MYEYYKLSNSISLGKSLLIKVRHTAGWKIM